MIISWKTSVSTRHVVINNFKIISIKLIKIRTKGTNLFTQYSSLGYLLFLSFIRRKSMLGKRKMTFLFFSFFILFTRAAGGLFLSMSQLYKYWTIRRRRKKREKILEHSSTWFDCNEAHPMIKLVPKRNCTTGFISKKRTFYTPAHSWTVQTLSRDWYDSFSRSLFIWVRWWWGPSTQTIDSIPLTLNEVPVPFSTIELY
jgi:hypothetical protein